MPIRSPAKLSLPAETVMTRRIVQIIEQIPMSEVRKIATRYDYNGFPVVTPEGRLVGMITKGDLLRVACAALDDPAAWQAPVSRFMAHGVLALWPTDSLAAAVQYMTESKLRSLPVIDAGSRVVGMISRNDLMPHDRVVGGLDDRREQRAGLLVLGRLALQGVAGHSNLARAPSILEEHGCEEHDDQPGQPGQGEEDVQRLPRVPRGLSGQDLPLLRLHGRHCGPDLLHQTQTPPGQHPLHRGFGTPLAAELDRCLQLAELRGHERSQDLHVALAASVSRAQTAELPDVLIRGGEGAEIRSEVSLVLGHEEAALPGFGVGHRQQDAVQLVEDLAGVADRLVVVGDVARADRDDDEYEQETGGQRECEACPMLGHPGHHAGGPPIHAGWIVGPAMAGFKLEGRLRAAASARIVECFRTP